MTIGQSIHIGTSGWCYPHWKGPFYPANLPDDALLGHYATRFRTVEIDNSFYRLPSEYSLDRWRDTVPPGFVFAAKASRYITHMKKLKDPGQTLPPFLRRIELLGEKLGPILFQLPPQLGFSDERLSDFLQALPPGHRYAVEFRNPGWFIGRTYARLRQHNVAFCIYDLDGRLSPREVTADFAYIRLHGPDGPYRGQYDAQTLASWASAIHRWAAEGKSVYCYFDNDQAGFAAQDAERLREMLPPRKPPTQSAALLAQGPLAESTASSR